MPKKKPKRSKTKTPAAGTTREQARAYVARWQRYNDWQLEQLRAMTPGEKLAEWERLMLWAREMGWDKKLKEEEQQVRETWARLRKAWRERQ